MIKYKIIEVVILSLLFLVCGKTKSPVREPAGFHFESFQSSCKNGSNTEITKVIQGGSPVISSHGDTIFVTQDDVLLNCCTKIQVNIVQTSDGFDLCENEVGETCNCTCLFDVKTIICNLSNGTYYVRVFDPSGNCVGSETVDIPAKFSVYDSQQSKCKSKAAKMNVQNNSMDSLEDSILVWFQGDTCKVTHKNAYYNCCSTLKTNLERTPRGFNLYEYDTATDWCFCLCYFDITTTIYGLLPGAYLIQVFETDSSLVDSVLIEIPPKYAGSETSQSKCKGRLYKTGEEASSDINGDSIMVSFDADTVWVVHPQAFYNCCSIIKTRVERNSGGFDLYEYDVSIMKCKCMCYFDITTAIYGVSTGVYLIHEFDTAGDLVGEMEFIVPPA